jgi:hypothetical protein
MSTRQRQGSDYESIGRQAEPGGSSVRFAFATAGGVFANLNCGTYGASFTEEVPHG